MTAANDNLCTPENPCRGCRERGVGPAHESEVNAATSPRCGCEKWCGDLPEERDDPNAHCKGLKPKPENLVELVLVKR